MGKNPEEFYKFRENPRFEREYENSSKRMRKNMKQYERIPPNSDNLEENLEESDRDLENPGELVRIRKNTEKIRQLRDSKNPKSRNNAKNAKNPNNRNNFQRIWENSRNVAKN